MNSCVSISGIVAGRLSNCIPGFAGRCKDVLGFEVDGNGIEHMDGLPR